MPTLVLAPRQNDDARRMARAAADIGWDVFGATAWRDFPTRLRNMDPILYSDTLFADTAVGPLNLALLEPTPDWLVTLPPRYLSREVSFITLNAARSLAGPIFLKPAADKSFPADVYIDPVSELPPYDWLLEDIPVLAAQPVTWTVEYRCFVVEREIAACSVYFRNGRLAQDIQGAWGASPEEEQEAVRFARAVLENTSVEMPSAVVLDVGHIAGRGWAVVEANPAWGSGLYGCDPKAILPVLKRACLSRDAVTTCESKWLRPRPKIEG
jgi:hypothetical protein